MLPVETQSQFHKPIIVKISDEERISGRITEDHVGIAVSAMHRDGLVVLENAVNVEHVDELNSILSSEAQVMAKLPTTHFNDNSSDRPTGNMSQGPPLTPELMYTDIWANELSSTVISAIMGPSPRVNYVNGNTALGGFDDARQRVHADLTFNHGLFPFAIVTNYYLCDVSPANGSTELWLGSHRDTSFHDHRNCRDTQSEVDYDETLDSDFGIRDELLEERRTWAPPIQPTVKKGSVVLRDLRLWHAGLANPAREARIMLAFVHTPWWYQCPAKVALPTSAGNLISEWATRKNSPVVYNAHFIAGDLDHKQIAFNPDFSSANEGYSSMLPKGISKGFIFGMHNANGANV